MDIMHGREDCSIFLCNVDGNVSFENHSTKVESLQWLISFQWEDGEVVCLVGHRFSQVVCPMGHVFLQVVSPLGHACLQTEHPIR